MTDQFDIFYVDPIRVIKNGYKDYLGPESYKEPMHLYPQPYNNEPYALIRENLKAFNGSNGHPHVGTKILVYPRNE